MRRLWLLPLLLLVFVGFLSAGENQESINVKGRISGVLCAAHDMLCPADPEHGKKAELLGVFTEEKKFYYLANVPHRLLELNFLKEVEATGEPLSKLSSMIVKELKIKGRPVFKDDHIIDPMGHKVLPGDAKEIGGEFYCPKCAEAKGMGGASRTEIVGIEIPVEGMTCPDCEAKVEKGVKELNGVIKVKADYKKGVVNVKFDKGKVSLDSIVEAINKAGYNAKKP